MAFRRVRRHRRRSSMYGLRVRRGHKRSFRKRLSRGGFRF